MKKIIFLFFCFPFFLSAQTINTEIDEFTGVEKKTTSWEVLHSAMNQTFFRLSSYDEYTLFELKYTTGKYKGYSAKEGSKLLIKLQNGEIIDLGNLEYVSPCQGCGARGFSGSALVGVHLRYIIEKNELELLNNNNIEKIRIYFNNSYEDFKASKKGNIRLKKAITLITSSK